MSNSTKKWYVLYTKPGCEKKVANLLSRRNIENYCPLTCNLNGRNRTVQEPLFNSYVFVQTAESAMQQIRKTDNVVNFVYWLGKPAVVEEEEIGIMRQFVIEYANVKMEKIPIINVDGMERVIGGALADNTTQTVTFKNNIVKIVLPSLGYIMQAEAEQSKIEVFTSSKKSYTLVEKYQYAIQKYNTNSVTKF